MGEVHTFVLNFCLCLFCLYICLCFVAFCQTFSFACFLLGQLVPLSRVTAETGKWKERGHSNKELKQEMKEGRVQALKQIAKNSKEA